MKIDFTSDWIVAKRSLSELGLFINSFNFNSAARTNHSADSFSDSVKIFSEV